MDDIKRRNWKVFSQELLSPGRLVLMLFVDWLLFLFLKTKQPAFSQFPLGVIPLWVLTFAACGVLAYRSSLDKRFINSRFKALWTGCQDRLTRFDEVLRKLRKDQIAELSEMPKTIHRVAESLYAALRRADMIAFEVSSTEHNLYGGPPVWQAISHDPQSKELYKIADKNIAEYRQRFEGVMAGVQRTEAQTAVFMTTLDTLRMKMLGYRLVGKSPEVSSQDFLEALNEAKLQLSAIDSALEELELGPYPQMIASMPPPVTPPPLPDDVRQRLGN